MIEAEGERLNGATDFPLDVFSSYNDISHLFPSNAEQVSAPPNNSTMTAAAAAALSLSVIPTDKASDAVTTSSNAAVTLSTKINVKKAKASAGGAKKRKTMASEVQQHTRRVSSASTVSGWVSSESGVELSNAVFGGRPSATMKKSEARVGKRFKLTGGVAESDGAKDAASRRAALAAAVSQYAPLAASQVSKIRQNASILEKSSNRGEIVKAVLNIANPLEQVTNSIKITNNHLLKRPATPNAVPEPRENCSSLVSPGGSETRLSVVSSVTSGTSSKRISSVARPVIPNITGVNGPSKAILDSRGELPYTTSQKTGESGSGKITTAHVNSLTSLNWSNTEAACTAVPCPVNAVPSSKAAASQAQKRRASLTLEDRAKQNRDRNREHARNTRLRKKAYVDELKKTLTEIVSQRDSLELEKIQTAELRNVRFSVIQEFLKLRSNSERDPKRWNAILDKSIAMRLPVTHYRKMTKQTDTETKAHHLHQEIKGIADVMNDAFMVSEMMLTFEVECEKSSFMTDGASAMVCWTAKSTGCIPQVSISLHKS